MKSKGSGNHKLLIFALVAAAGLVATGLAWEYTGGVRGRLPAVADLAPGRPVSTPLLESEAISVEPRLFTNSGGHVEAYDSEAVVRGDQGEAYCLYELGPFTAGDELTNLAVDVGVIDGYRNAYHLLTADFHNGRWRELPTGLNTESRNVFGIDTSWMLNDSGMLYLALAVDRGAAIKLNGIACRFSLVRGPAVAIRGDQLPREITGVPVAVPLTALDANGRRALDFDQVLPLTASSGSCTVSTAAAFSRGQARPTLTFDADGIYQLKIADSGQQIGGSLGTMELYTTDLPIYSIQLEPAALAELNADPYCNETRAGSISIGESPQLTAKLRYRGGSRRAAAKKSWKVKLTDGEYADSEWDTGRGTLNLVADCKDTTMMREKLSYDMVQDLGVPVPRTRYIHLRVNDVYQGLYVDVENPRREWLRAMGYNDEGSLYKASFSRLTAYDDADEYESRYEKQAGNSGDFADLAQLCRQISELNSLDDDDAYEGLSQLFDIDLLTEYFVALTLISSRENWICNYYVYHDTEDTGKWLIFPWDMDMTWGIDTERELKADQALDHYCRSSALTSLFFKNRRLQTGYYLALADALRTSFSPERIGSRIDDYYSLVAMDVAADLHKKPLKQDYQLYVQGLKGYVRHRSQFIRSELERLVAADTQSPAADGAWARFGRGSGPGG